jgi:hypothetical protein
MVFNCDWIPASFRKTCEYYCNVCSFKRNWKDNLNRHKKSKHEQSTLKTENEVDEIVNYIECNPSKKIHPIESEKSKLLPTYFDWVSEVENEEALQQGRKR